MIQLGSQARQELTMDRWMHRRLGEKQLVGWVWNFEEGSGLQIQFKSQGYMGRD